MNTKLPIQTKYTLVRTPADLAEYMGLAHPYRILEMKFTIGKEYWTWCGGDHPYEATGGEKRIHKSKPVRQLSATRCAGMASTEAAEGGGPRAGTAGSS
jgi:hypothetical protein